MTVDKEEMAEAILNLMNGAKLLGLPRMTVDQIHQMITLINIFKEQL